jgi:hypothetical protein
MSHRHGFVAWIEPKDGHYAAAFVSGVTRGLRAPATRLFRSNCEARGWVEQEAAALGGVPVAWVDEPDSRGEVVPAELLAAA